MILHIFCEDVGPIINGIIPLNNFSSIIRIVKLYDIKERFVRNLIKTFITENNILI
jgi:5,10-methylenetetrahydrofolate reductase